MSTPKFLVALLCGSALGAQQVWIQPSSYASGIDGDALHLACIAELKRIGDDNRFVESFRAKSAGERRVCLDHLLQSLTPAPDFTAADFRRALIPNDRGDYYLDWDRRMSSRLGVNHNAARAIAALTRERLLADAAVIPRLVECLDHPLRDVGAWCNDALSWLTRHPYGNDLFGRHYGALPLTVENHRQAVADWAAYSRLLAKGHPIYNEWLAAQCLAAARAVSSALIQIVPGTPAAGYLRNLDTTNIHASFGERIFEFDVGRHNAANWWPNDPALTRIALLVVRPGIARAGASNDLERVMAPFHDPDYRETFGALDLEVRFMIGTTDEALRRRAVLAVQTALSALRTTDRRE